MKTKLTNREDVTQLEDIPNIGASIANDLRMIGIDQPRHLVGKDPYKLYDKLCEVTNVRHDPCVIDCFISAVRYMEGAPNLPWWHYTPERKQTCRPISPKSASPAPLSARVPRDSRKGPKGRVG